MHAVWPLGSGAISGVAAIDRDNVVSGADVGRAEAPSLLLSDDVWANRKTSASCLSEFLCEGPDDSSKGGRIDHQLLARR